MRQSKYQTVCEFSDSVISSGAIGFRVVATNALRFSPVKMAQKSLMRRIKNGLLE